MAYDGSQAQTDHKIGSFGLVMKIKRNKNIKAGSDNSFDHVGSHYEGTPFGTQDAEGIGGTGVTAAVFANVNSEEMSTDPDGSRYRAYQVC
jgi:hypothetical protein